jgi:nitrous oxidase accessory protein NosD
MTQTSSCVFNYYVNASTGDDAATVASARNAATPWQTISHALQLAEPGATIVVAPGEYLETAQIQKDGVTLIAEPVGKAAIRALSGNAVTVEASSVTLDGFVLRGLTGVSALAGSDELAIRNCIALDSSSDGFRVVDSTGVTIEDSRAIGSAFSGILLRRVDDATVRNNLLYDNGEWGLSLDNSPMGSQVLAPSAGNLVAENTIAFNTLGNLRLANAAGEIRDNRSPTRSESGSALTPMARSF